MCDSLFQLKRRKYYLTASYLLSHECSTAYLKTQSNNVVKAIRARRLQK